MKEAAELFADCKLTDKQREIINIAGKVGREKIAPRAASIDRDARNPMENYADLQACGIHVMCVPERFGGLGHDYTTYLMVASELGRHCGSTALSFNMHASTTLWIGNLLDKLDLNDDQRRELEACRTIHYRRIVEEGALYAQTFSEGNMAASGKTPFGTLAKRVSGGWLLNGKKIFASLSGAATHYGILCTEDKDEQRREDTLYIAVPTDAEGFSVSGDWDPLGMRGTVSRDLQMKDVFVPNEAQIMPRGTYHLAAKHIPHMFLTLCGTYVGIAQGAYDFTVQYLRGEIPGFQGTKARQHPAKQYAVAEMHIKLEQIRSLFIRSIQEVQVNPPKAVRMRAYSTQYTVMEGAVDICRLAVRTCGGRGMLKTFPLERMYRDARCGSLMFPWTAELCLDRLGRETLYEKGESDD
ncbi:MAG: acyl-CoA/acyl-ACP dehydrogenase [SAR324 cluster bacterium]|nr:acyl-CoA/acyl-ACP dehydrogenase [SAR324 cluster bacterium]